MSTSREPAKWNNDAAALLNQFLHTKTGRLFLLQLDYLRPGLSVSNATEPVALQAKYVGGYEDAVSNVIALSQPVQEDGTRILSDYPDLEDDSLWPELPKREEAQPPPRERQARVIPKPEVPAVPKPTETPK